MKSLFAWLTKSNNSKIIQKQILNDQNYSNNSLVDEKKILNWTCKVAIDALVWYMISGSRTTFSIDI